MITVYGLTYCPWSKEALALLKQKKIKHKMVWVTDETKTKYKKKHKMDTFPQIFYGKTEVGGFEDLEELVNVAQAVKDSEFDSTLVVKMSKQLK